MIERIFIVLIDGRVYRKDTAIRTYKTYERAVKETSWYVKAGRRVEIGELTLSNITEIKGAD